MTAPYITKVEDLQTRRNGKGARPNVYTRSLGPRETTDAFLRLAAGLDTDVPTVPWWRKLTVWELGLLVLGAIGLLVMVLA